MKFYTNKRSFCSRIFRNCSTPLTKVGKTRSKIDFVRKSSITQTLRIIKVTTVRLTFDQLKRLTQTLCVIASFIDLTDRIFYCLLTNHNSNTSIEAINRTAGRSKETIRTAVRLNLLLLPLWPRQFTITSYCSNIISRSNSSKTK